MTVVLIGFMGAGKSKVGRIVANRLGVPFVDTDDLIEERAGRKISDIFQNDGEAAFRDLETEAIRTALGRGPGIVALGGGAATFERNWEILRGSGALTIYLKTDPKSIIERVGGQSHRPLLAGLSRAEMRAKIERMLAERGPWYERADVILPTDNSRDKYGMADIVVSRIREEAER